MKALILAAGFGSRLLPITENRPKSLVPVNGTPILFKQIDNLLENGITDITVISGYKAEILEECLLAKYPNISIIRSIDYESTNNMYSAWLAREYFCGCEFLMMNADVFFDASVIRSLLAFEGPDAVVVDMGNYLEESMKVIEKDGRLVQIAKTISPEEALGVSIDVYKFSPAGSNAFFRVCEKYIAEKKELKLWSEVALNDAMGDVKFQACPLVGRWFEIDNHDDLRIASELFANDQ